MENSTDGKIIKDYAHRINILQHRNWIGDIMPFDDFVKYVDEGYFIDYDGFGKFVDDTTGEEILSTRCDVEWLKKHKPANSNYVMWYNN